MPNLNTKSVPDLSVPERMERSPNFSVFGYHVAEGSEVVAQEMIHSGNLDAALDYKAELGDRPDPLDSRVPRLSRLVLKLAGREDEVLTPDERKLKRDYSIEPRARNAKEMLGYKQANLEMWQKNARGRFRLYSERANKKSNQDYDAASAAQANFHKEMPQIVRDAYESSLKEAGEHKSLFEWLAGGQDGESGATDEQLTNFLQWNVDKYEKINAQPETRAMFEREKVIYGQRLQLLVDEGLLPEVVMDRLAAFDSGNILVGEDLLFTMDRFGHHLNGVIEVAKIHDQHHIDHELTHAVIQSDEEMDTWYKEAVTETLTRYMQPDKEGLKVYYLGERELFFKLLNAGLSPLDTDLAIRAYAERGEDRTARDQFTEEVRAAYPWSDNIVDDLTKILQDERFKDGDYWSKFDFAKQWLEDGTSKYRAATNSNLAGVG